MSKLRFVLPALLLTVLAAGPLFAAAPSYTITDLGSLGGNSVARAVNEFGQVVGTYEPSLGKTCAFLWTPQGGLLDLPGRGGDNTFAYDINNAGQIVGGADAFGAEPHLHARLWDTAGNPTDLNPGDDYWSAAYAINENGRAVLQAGLNSVGYGTRLVLWDAANGFDDRRYLEGTDAIAWDINNTGDVALNWEARGSRPDVVGTDAPAYSWNPEWGFQFIPPMTGSVSGNSYGINDSLLVAGGFAVSVDRETVWHAFLFVPQYGNNPSYERPFIGRGTTYDLGTLGGDTIAWSISNHAQIVGVSVLEDGTLHAFLSQPDDPNDPNDARVLHDLNSLLLDNPGWVLNEAYDVNEVGQIVGYGVNPAGDTHAFLLTPVPEPATAGVVRAAVALLCPRRARP